MIIDVWGPKFVKINGKKEISFFEIKKTQNMINLKKTGWIVRYICDRCKDNKVCTTTSHVFFNEKYIYNTLDSQICKSCRSRISEYEIKKSFIPYEKIKLYINEYKYFDRNKKVYTKCFKNLVLSFVCRCTKLSKNRLSINYY